MYDSRLFCISQAFCCSKTIFLDYNDSLSDENSIYLELIIVILHPKPNIKLKESEYEQEIITPLIGSVIACSPHVRTESIIPAL